jgi:hypothetical protein
VATSAKRESQLLAAALRAPELPDDLRAWMQERAEAGGASLPPGPP